MPSAEPAAEEKKAEAKPATIASAVPVAVPPQGTSTAQIPTAVDVPVSVRHGNVLTCKTADGTQLKGKECGTLSLDDQALPRIRALGKCPQAAGVTGKLSLVFSIDFDKGRLNAVPGRTSTVKNLDALSECLRPSIESMKLKAIRHDHPVYSVAYSALFGTDDHGKAESDAEPVKPSGKADAGKGAAREPKENTGGKGEAPGIAEIAWDSAIVRDAPKTGTIVGRIPKGAKVKSGTYRDGWYNVHFGDGFSQEGWIYKGAIGR